MCRNHPAVGIPALTALLRKDDKTISNDNEELGVLCHNLGFPHKGHLPAMETLYVRNVLESDEFYQCEDEYRLDEYSHKILLFDRKCEHISHPLLLAL